MEIKTPDSFQWSRRINTELLFLAQTLWHSLVMKIYHQEPFHVKWFLQQWGELCTEPSSTDSLRWTWVKNTGLHVQQSCLLFGFLFLFSAKIGDIDCAKWFLYSQCLAQGWLQIKHSVDVCDWGWIGEKYCSTKNTNSKRYIYPCIHCSIASHSQDMEAI